MQVMIRANTAQEEFEYLKYLLGRLDFYKKNNYKISLPAIPEFKKPIEKEREKELYKLFKNKEYSIEYYAKGLAYLSSKKALIENCVSELLNLKKFWDFKSFDEYKVCLTKYGPGGSHNSELGKITMLTDTEGKFKRDVPEHTVVHEIVHIGVQKSIVESYNLTHWEKESLVDLIVKVYLGGYLDNYVMQNISDNNLKTYITNRHAIENLPNTLTDYKNQ